MITVEYSSTSKSFLTLIDSEIHILAKSFLSRSTIIKSSDLHFILLYNSSFKALSSSGVFPRLDVPFIGLVMIVSPLFLKKSSGDVDIIDACGSFIYAW